jgi:phosphotransferase system enzyme I (PtsI)
MPVLADEAAARTVTGIGVCAGIAAGRVFHLTEPITEPSPGLRLGPRADHRAEADRIETASDRVQAALVAAAERATGQHTKEMLEATAAMSADPMLVSDAQRRVTEEHLVAERAVWEAAESVKKQFQQLGGYFAERTSDINDIRDRVIAELSGRLAPGLPMVDEPYVLVAPDLAPSIAATLDENLVLAIVTDGAGPTSHTAIIANAKGIPAVVAALGATEQLRPGVTALVNGSSGVVVASPSDEQVASALKHAQVVRTFDGHGHTKDGHAIAILANVGDTASAREAAAANAEGVGLFRTEFCFLDRTESPTVNEQVEQYGELFAQFPDKKVVIRTLDSGADKPLPFLTFDNEENPALGVRGYRTAGRAPELLDEQLEAIAQAASAHPSTDVWVMAPMVSTVDEAEAFVESCSRHGLNTAGVMIEVPSAALLSSHILASARFASIGTNDLTQYAMAADRLMGPLAQYNDPWQPAVLQLIDAACKGGKLNDRPVGVCGEAAANPALAIVLVGLGVSTVSMSPRAIPDVAAALAAVEYKKCLEVARTALQARNAREARRAVRAALPELAALGL